MGESAFDVGALRVQAQQRARARGNEAFTGTVQDGFVRGTPTRTYEPAAVGPGAIVFCHGGYGLFGDIDLQDNWCRRLATNTGWVVVSVDYPLAPESPFAESARCVVEVADALIRQRDCSNTVLAGDSAGAAVVLAAAASLVTRGSHVRAVLATNPNVDATLGSFDAARGEEPSRSLSEFAMNSWFRGSRRPNFCTTWPPAGPPVFVAVGDSDPLYTEGIQLADASGGAALTLPGAGHGLVGSRGYARQISRWFAEVLGG